MSLSMFQHGRAPFGVERAIGQCHKGRVASLTREFRRLLFVLFSCHTLSTTGAMTGLQAFVGLPSTPPTMAGIGGSRGTAVDW